MESGMKFVKKPVVIEAFQWDGTVESAEAISKLFPELRTNSFAYSMNLDDKHPEGWTIHTLEGLITAMPNDWIIKGIQGEFYPCIPDIFEQTYSFWSAT
jgi:hypothetical protein